MKNKVRKIVIGGVFSALVIVLGVSGLGFIPLPSGALVIIHVPVIIAAILEGPVVGLFTGLLFGIFSIIQAGTIGVSPVDLAFLHHPWIAIGPRVVIGPAAWLLYSLVSGAVFARFRRTAAVRISVAREIAAIVTGAVTGSLVNTVLVLTALSLVLPEVIPWQVLLTLISINGIMEASFSAAISLAVLLPWKGLSRRNKSKLSASLETKEEQK